MHERATRSPARFLAPLALIAVVVVFLAIVSGSGGGGGSSSSASSTTTPTSTTTSSKKSAAAAAKANARAKRKAAAKKAAGSRFYVVQTGDTLGAIAAKTGVPLATIQSLNPAVDPHAMTTGQKIRLK